ncbi:MAG: DeoR/GlpR transcriptional regulator [Clostridia bacterium]|nr:DeoR/GlpR transcriptional regulator [Clostridia bacterium]
MYQKERLDNIMQIVKSCGYVTVKYLVATLHYSNATINRDLNALEKQKKIKRTYGGVEYTQTQGVPLPFRYNKMRASKLKIAKRATELVGEGEVIFVDASTTCEYMTEYLAEKKDITVITNNMALVMRLSEYGVNAVCLGGRIVESPCMLDGAETVENALKYRADKAFFSTAELTKEGEIGTGEIYYLLHNAMIRQAKEAYLLIDSEKIKPKSESKRALGDLEVVTGVVSDYGFDEETRKKFPKTAFIKA